jgi:hypothetical protein
MVSGYRSIKLTVFCRNTSIRSGSAAFSMPGQMVTVL